MTDTIIPANSQYTQRWGVQFEVQGGEHADKATHFALEAIKQKVDLANKPTTITMVVDC